MSGKQSISDDISGLVGFIGAIPWAAAFVMFVKDVGQWIKYGKWPHYTTLQMLSDLGFNYHPSSLIGLRKIVDMLFNTSAIVGLLIGGILAGMIATVVLSPIGLIIEAIQRKRHA